MRLFAKTRAASVLGFLKSRKPCGTLYMKGDIMYVPYASAMLQTHDLLRANGPYSATLLWHDKMLLCDSKSIALLFLYYETVTLTHLYSTIPRNITFSYGEKLGEMYDKTAITVNYQSYETMLRYLAFDSSPDAEGIKRLKSIVMDYTDDINLICLLVVEFCLLWVFVWKVIPVLLNNNFFAPTLHNLYAEYFKTREYLVLDNDIDCVAKRLL